MGAPLLAPATTNGCSSSTLEQEQLPHKRMTMRDESLKQPEHRRFACSSQHSPALHSSARNGRRRRGEKREGWTWPIGASTSSSMHAHKRAGQRGCCVLATQRLPPTAAACSCLATLLPRVKMQAEDENEEGPPP